MNHQNASSAPSHAAALRIGLFFDGTGNNQCNLALDAGGEGFSYRNARSNIALLHALYPQGTLGSQVFVRHYVHGIGTRTGQPDSTFTRATGTGATGVEARVAEALAWAGEQASQLASPLPVVFDLFGFSRGAAAARHLANLLGAQAEDLPVALRGERAINFIGLFDTVAAIVEPLRWDFDPTDMRNAGLRLGLPKGIARRVVQLVAADERRQNFPLIRTDGDIMVPGVHANVGGGYLESMRERVLLCKPFSQRVAQTLPAEQTRAYQQAAALLASDFATLGEPPARVVSWETPAASAVQRIRAQKQVYAAVEREREVDGHLSRVYLSIMRELGERGGVPFAPLGDEPAHRLPEELLEISRKLHEFALGDAVQLALSDAELALLRGKYIHTSAHWNALSGLRGGGLDFLYVNRPAQGGRVMHDNPTG